MERSVRIDDKILRKAQAVNPFALETVRRKTGAIYEYCIDGIWTTNKPNKRPGGRRTVFKSIEDFRAARDIYSVWQYIESQKAYDPARPEEVIERFAEARIRQSSLTLFIPWGVRPEGKPTLEWKVMDRIKQLDNLLKSKGIRSQILLMPADLYATEVNQIAPDLTNVYFDLISQQASQRGFIVKPWSEIKAENIGQYVELSEQLTEAAIISRLPEPVLAGAMGAAERRSGFLEGKDIRTAAFRYLRERICEATIVEQRYKPIKVSLVKKDKDSVVDADLPRIYIVPKEEQFPWLKL